MPSKQPDLFAVYVWNSRIYVIVEALYGYASTGDQFLIRHLKRFNR